MYRTPYFHPKGRKSILFTLPIDSSLFSPCRKGHLLMCQRQCTELLISILKVERVFFSLCRPIAPYFHPVGRSSFNVPAVMYRTPYFHPKGRKSILFTPIAPYFHPVGRSSFNVPAVMYRTPYFHPKAQKSILIHTADR